MPLFEIGDKVRMKQDILNELDQDGSWSWHESLKGKILTVCNILSDQPGSWVDYYVEESPFCLAEGWLELVEKKESEPNAEV